MKLKIINKDLTWQEVIIDQEDSFLAFDHNWRVRKHRNTEYAFFWEGKRRIYMHRVIMAPNPGEFVDHINGNGLDNRRENLRICTVQQNLFNMRAEKDTVSGIKGVCWDKQKSLWMAKIMLDGKTINLGRFKNKEHAAEAYNRAAKDLFGVFSRLSTAKVHA